MYLFKVTTDGFEQKISDFASNIKTKVNKLIVGFKISGSQHASFPNDTRK